MEGVLQRKTGAWPPREEPETQGPPLRVRLKRTKKSLLCLKKDVLDISWFPPLRFVLHRLCPSLSLGSWPQGCIVWPSLFFNFQLDVASERPGWGSKGGAGEGGAVCSLLLLLCHQVSARSFISSCSSDEASPPRCDCHWLHHTVLSPGPLRPRKVTASRSCQHLGPSPLLLSACVLFLEISPFEPSWRVNSLSCQDPYGLLLAC